MSEKKAFRPSKRSKRPPLGICIMNMIFNIFTKCLRFVFQMIYGAKGESMPPITDPILLDSATTIARKIRQKEVSKSKYLPYIEVAIE